MHWAACAELEHHDCVPMLLPFTGEQSGSGSESSQQEERQRSSAGSGTSGSAAPSFMARISNLASVVRQEVSVSSCFDAVLSHNVVQASLSVCSLVNHNHWQDEACVHLAIKQQLASGRIHLMIAVQQ